MVVMMMMMVDPGPRGGRPKILEGGNRGRGATSSTPDKEQILAFVTKRNCVTIPEILPGV